MPILDPRNGDIEDDAASTKRRSLLSLMGSLLAEISLPKLIIAWMLLVGFPGLLLGAAPLLVSIWIASVIAKVARDSAMAKLAALYPGYGLENHKGYGTPEHARALTLHGPCPIHRRLFKPIRERTYAAADGAGGDRELW